MCVFISQSANLTLFCILSCALKDFHFSLRSQTSPGDGRTMMVLELFVFAALLTSVSTSADVCTNSFLPGAKGNAHPTHLKSENAEDV